MHPRQETILRLIIDAYVATAEPVGSKALLERHELGVSPATIRNDMAALERDGYLVQPHTSAGRVPTEKAYMHYVAHFVKPREEKRAEARLRQAAKKEAAVKAVAKTVRDVSGEMVIVAANPRTSYYTGVSNLIRKPDFAAVEALHSISELVDEFDEVVHQMHECLADEPGVFIGSENPFGPSMSALIVRYGNEPIGMIGIIGPLRMNYQKNLALLSVAADVLSELDSYEGT